MATNRPGTFDAPLLTFFIGNIETLFSTRQYRGQHVLEWRV
jgi:hypothetical protein